MCDEAVYEVFKNVALDYVETTSRRAYLLRFAAKRPLTIRLLEQAWKSCQANEARHERGELLNSFQQPQTPEAPANLDGLSDQAVDDLYHRSLQEYAQQFRHGTGVLA